MSVPSRDDEAVLDRRTGAEPDPRSGCVAPGPVHPAVAGLEPVVEREPTDRVVEAGSEPPLVVELERQLVRGARDLRVEHERVLRVHHGRFGRAAEQLAGVRGVPLVELVVAGDEHRRCASRPASGPPDLLPQRCERPREAVEHDRVERADVDAELERVRGRDAEQGAVGERAFELATLAGEVAGPVRRDPFRGPGAVSASIVARVGRDELGATPRAGERERRWPSATKRARTRAVSTLADARAPECSSSSGRCQIAKLRAPRGAPSSSIAVTGSPHSSDASSAGLPMVALAKQNDGEEP